MKKFFKENISIIAILVIVIALTVTGIAIITYQHHISTFNKWTLSISIISSASLIFSYFYNKIMERRIALHSEAQWRPRLYNLMAKKEITYNDVLYFTAFFNVHKEEKKNKNKNDVDIAIRNAIKCILEDNSITLNTKLKDLYSLKNSTKNDSDTEDQSSGDSSEQTLLGEFNNKILNMPLNEEQVILFKACISELLKADWDRQK